MRFAESPLRGAYVIDVEELRDARGFFARAWCAKEFKEHGLKPEMIQANISVNTKPATIRGLHYQIEPFQECKLVRCTRGAIYDVLVDMRPDSPTRGRWFGVELTAQNHRMLYVPEGCAHGYQSLVADTEVMYHVSQVYSPECERGLRWNDPSIGIDWPLRDGIVVSEKDRSWPDYR
jgi:dTDP-4-dehydrorhamnose 3,5-epimerase